MSDKQNCFMLQEIHGAMQRRTLYQNDKYDTLRSFQPNANSKNKLVNDREPDKQIL